MPARSVQTSASPHERATAANRSRSRSAPEPLCPLPFACERDSRLTRTPPLRKPGDGSLAGMPGDCTMDRDAPRQSGCLSRAPHAHHIQEESCPQTSMACREPQKAVICDEGKIDFRVKEQRAVTDSPCPLSGAYHFIEWRPVSRARRTIPMIKLLLHWLLSAVALLIVSQ